MKNQKKGFSLIELLIVVAIILIIAAIAIPNLLRAKAAANESSAVATLRTYNTAIVAYENLYQTAPTTDMSQLGPFAAGGKPSAVSADLVDNLIGKVDACKSNYCFGYAPTVAADGTVSFWNITAGPTSPVNGQKTFFMDQSGVIRYRTDSGPATVTDTPIGG